MRPLKCLFVLWLLACLPTLAVAGRFGLSRGRCGGVGNCPYPATVGIAPDAMPATGQPQAALARSRCPGGICPASPRACGCGCSDGCDCCEGACPCKLGKEPCNADCKCLLHGSPAVDSAKYPGVLTDRLGRGGHTINGRPVSRHQLVQALTTVPDDRAFLSLTFCGGTDAERAAGVALAKELGLDRKCLVQAIPAESPLLKPGFVVPSVYLQSPDGLVLCRAEKADRASMEAIRDEADNYDPAKDPKPASGLTLADVEKWLAAVPGWAWGRFCVVGGSIGSQSGSEKAMTLATILPYLLVAGGYLLRHFDVLGKLLGLLAGSNPLASPSGPGAPALPKALSNHPVLSDAVNAAIQKGIQDAMTGHVSSLRDELRATVSAAVAAAVADLKAKA